MARTTILLDDASERAADDLARTWGCSRSEAIRRAIARAHDEGSVSAARRERRLRAFHRLCDLFEGHDADAEIARVREERQALG